MAIFGEGLRGDPLAEARANDIARAKATRQRNIENLGKGQNAFGKGVTALSTVAGEHIGAAIAGAFGYEKPDSPEVAAAKSQAQLLEQINMIEEDPSTAAHSKASAALAMEAGKQDVAYQFIQQAGVREKAEGQKAVAVENARVKVLAENYSRLPSSMQLELISQGNPDVFASLNIDPESDEGKALVGGAGEQIESNLLKVKAQVADLKNSLSAEVGKQDLSSTAAWLPSANVNVYAGFNAGEEATAAMTEAVALQVSAEANSNRAIDRENQIIKPDSFYNQAAFDTLVENGTLLIEKGEGKTLWGMRGEDVGSSTVIGFGSPTPVDPAPATEKKAPAVRRVNLQ